MQKRILILSASNGSGHVRAAQAIEEVFKKDKRVSEVLHIDTLEYTNFLFRRIYSKGYLDAVRSAPELWALAFEATDKPWQTPPVVSAMHRLNSRPLVRKIQEYKPDICICTHGMPAEVISNLIMEDKLQTNLGIVVTDFYVHALWLSDVFTRFFVPKEENKVHLSLLGLPLDRIVVSGIPILEAFTTKVAKSTLRNKYSLASNLPLVLLSAGAFGMMSASDILKILEQIKTRCQIVVICGKNKKLQDDLEGVTTGGDAKVNNSYSIIGYTDAMHDYLRMADVFIGKPGGLSTSECLACGVPMVVWDPIPGQEVYNTYHILEHGAGVMPNNAITIGFKVDEILSNPELHKRMSTNALALSLPHAAKTVVDEMLAHENETPVKAFKKIL
jgi:processive 1,2-diacylglycerol beta-glucosyltransferase